jgi:uncharacterized protein (TIGR02001 family)
MKKLILASAISAAFVGSFAQAEEAAKSDHVISYNLGVTSDYVFRGISQSRNRPAFSGGVDYSHTPTGLYAGTWVSTISWIDDSYSAANMTNSASRPRTPYEQDFYAGIKIGDAAGLNFDVGTIYYYYPRNKLDTSLGTVGLKANTNEVYGKIAYGPVYFKASYAIGDAIWVSNKSGSYYLDLGADVPVMDGLVLNAHVGRFVFKQDATVLTDSRYNYSDWKIGLTKDFGGGLSGSLAATGTNAKDTLNGSGVWNFNSTGYLGDTKGIVSLTKTF